MMYSTGRKKKQKMLQTNNESVTDGREIVNRFNDYFVNVGPNLAKKTAASANLSCKDYLKGLLYGFGDVVTCL